MRASRTTGLRVRYLVCLLAGLVAGAVIASMLSNALAARHAWPRGVMNVLQHDLVDARAATRDARCAEPPQAQAHARMQALATGLERVLLAPGSQDRVLSGYARDLRHALAAWDPGAPCAEQDKALTDVANACDACHRDYR
jgi:hypothetical protein